MNEDGDAARAKSFVRDLGVADTLELPGPLLDRALDIVLGHRRRACRLDCGAQPRIPVRIAAAGPGRDRDLTDELGKQRPPLCVGGRFVVLDLLPLAVTSHGRPGYAYSENILPLRAPRCACSARYAMRVRIVRLEVAW